MAKHVTDYTKSSKQIVVDLINEQNGADVAAEKISLVDMVATPESNETRITATAVRGGGYRGSQTFTYRRVRLNEIPNVEQEAAHEADIAKLSDVLGFINLGWRVNLQPGDVTINGTDLSVSDPVVEQVYDVPQTFTLAALVENPVWMGTLEFSLTKTRQDLADLITLTLLDGLYAPSWWPDDYVFTGTGGDIRIREDGTYRAFAGLEPPPAE